MSAPIEISDEEKNKRDQALMKTEVQEPYSQPGKTNSGIDTSSTLPIVKPDATRQALSAEARTDTKSFNNPTLLPAISGGTPDKNSPLESTSTGLRLFGPADNALFFMKHLAISPLLTDLLVTRNLGLHPFNGSCDDTDIVTMIHLLSAGRASYLGIKNCDDSLCYSVTMAETIGPHLPESLFLPEEKARSVLVKSVQSLISNKEVLSKVYPNFTLAVWKAALVGHENKEVFKDPEFTQRFGTADEDDFNVKTPESAIRILKFLSKVTLKRMRKTPEELLVNLTISMTKRGVVSERIVTKVQDGLERDLGKPVFLNNKALGIFYQHFGGHINDTTIIDIIDSLIPKNGVRLFLTIQKLAGSGLTTYIIIVRALMIFQDFRWNLIQQAYPSEWTNFNDALKVVGDNLYYGFRKNLGVATATHYKSLGYVAKELLIRVNGENNLKGYQGWTKRVALQTQIDDLIQNYARKTSVERIGVSKEEIPDDMKIFLRDISATKYPNIAASGPSA